MDREVGVGCSELRCVGWSLPAHPSRIGAGFEVCDAHGGAPTGLLVTGRSSGVRSSVPHAAVPFQEPLGVAGDSPLDSF